MIIQRFGIALSVFVLSVLKASLTQASEGFAPGSVAGYVTEGSGVDGLVGAVVSLEWHVVRTVSTTEARPSPTVLAVWQTRTDDKGAFRLADASQKIIVPPGVKANPDAFPLLRVFALGYEPYTAEGLSRSVSISQSGRVSIKWPEPIPVLRLDRLAGSSQFMTTQVDGWYAEVKAAVQQEVWPHGPNPAIDSYGPLMGLLSETCYRYRRTFGVSTPTCERAKVEFALKEPAPRLQELPSRPQAPVDAQKKTQPVPLIAPSGDPYMDSSTKGDGSNP